MKSLSNSVIALKSNTKIVSSAVIFFIILRFSIKEKSTSRPTVWQIYWAEANLQILKSWKSLWDLAFVKNLGQAKSSSNCNKVCGSVFWLKMNEVKEIYFWKLEKSGD